MFAVVRIPRLTIRVLLIDQNAGREACATLNRLVGKGLLRFCHRD
jgi:hypothetical protein